MNKNIKLIITSIIILLGIYFIYNRKISLGIICIILSILPILLFFRNENILMAFWFLRKKNLKQTKKWLNNITNLDSQLFKQQHGYYYYLHGICESQNNTNKSEYFMKKALNAGLTFDHDKALAYLNLAASALNKAKKNEFEIYFNKAKKYDKANILGDQLKIIKEQSKKMNIGNNLHNPYIRLKRKYN